MKPSLRHAMGSTALRVGDLVPFPCAGHRLRRAPFGPSKRAFSSTRSLAVVHPERCGRLRCPRDPFDEGARGFYQCMTASYSGMM